MSKGALGGCLVVGRGPLIYRQKLQELIQFASAAI